jgi:hypothetical protein
MGKLIAKKKADIFHISLFFDSDFPQITGLMRGLFS